MRNIIATIYLTALFVLVPGVGDVSAQSQTKRVDAILRYDAIHHPVISRLGMVVSQRQLASDIGTKILEQGGNAVDAAVAVGYALSVLLPRAGNIGGGGFMLIYLKELDKTIAVDYREMAPRAAHKDMYLDEGGNVDQDQYRNGVRSVAVPGTVAGLEYVLNKYGTMSREQVMQPAISLAENGFRMDFDTSSAIQAKSSLLKRFDSSRDVFFKNDGTFYVDGDKFKQPKLAKALELISERGSEAFYSGEIAQSIVKQMEENGGIITLEDLSSYEVRERIPVQGSYHGYSVVSMPPPSSGGVHLIQMLNILENFDLSTIPAGSASQLHLLAETMKFAYADRSEHLGDSDFYNVPMDWLTSKGYAKEISKRIDSTRSISASEISAGAPPEYESVDTTHFSVVDSKGNAVSNTYTLNFSFGSGVASRDFGFLLNNEMTDFNPKAGMPGAFGLIGGTANSIEPKKRPLSAMTPTLIFKDDRLVLVTGSPGGSRIINTVLQQIVNIIDYKMNVAQASLIPRIHHQWKPDLLNFEESINPDTLNLLEGLGHKTNQTGTMGSLQSIHVINDSLHGVSDSRRPGAGVSVQSSEGN